MSGAGRGEPRGSHQPDGTVAARAHYARQGTAEGARALADVLAPHLAPEGPQVDVQGRRIGGRHARTYNGSAAAFDGFDSTGMGGE